MTGAQLFDKAIGEVESESIRRWARRQRDEWIRILDRCVAEDRTILGHRIRDNPEAVTAYIVGVGIGLF